MDSSISILGLASLSRESSSMSGYLAAAPERTSEPAIVEFPTPARRCVKQPPVAGSSLPATLIDVVLVSIFEIATSALA
jgi:hypothetical protein